MTTYAAARRIASGGCCLLALAAAAGCGGGAERGPVETPSPRPRAEAAVESYRPPPEGRLTPKQVELYISVIERMRTARSAAPSRPTPPERAPLLGDALESATPDVRAGREVFGNAEEYLWVKERILEAEGAELAARLNADELALLARTLADLKLRRERAPDEGSRTLISTQITQFEQEAERTTRESREREPEAVRANIRTLEPYRSRLSGLHSEIERIAPVAGALAARRATPTPIVRATPRRPPIAAPPARTPAR